MNALFIAVEQDMEWFKHEDSLRKSTTSLEEFQSVEWLANFLANYEISCQTQTEKKGMSNSFRVPLLQIFHESFMPNSANRGVKS